MLAVPSQPSDAQEMREKVPRYLQECGRINDPRPQMIPIGPHTRRSTNQPNSEEIALEWPCSTQVAIPMVGNGQGHQGWPV